MSTTVPGYGPTPNPVFLCGEKPGFEESRVRRPFVGKAGQLQRQVLKRNRVDVDSWYLTNLSKAYDEGNPDPTSSEVDEWTPHLIEELGRVRPEFIVAVGRFATRFFVGDVELNAVHGMPCRCRLPETNGAIVIPCYHPASALHNKDNLQWVEWDYGRVAGITRGEIPPDPVEDEFPNAVYEDALNAPVVELFTTRPAVALDTEGVPGDVWSWQVTDTPGLGIAVRKSQPMFDEATDTLLKCLRGKTLVGHNLMYEFEMFHSLGVDLLDPDLEISYWDTMVGAYIQGGLEPQSLKYLARRWCGMDMHEYREVVGDIGTQKQLDYLEEVWKREWPKPEERVKKSNDGTARLYTPQPISRRAEAILIDVYSEKRDKDGNLTDPMKRWKKCDRELRRIVEQELGPMPIGTLADIPLHEAIEYSGKDPDATLRLYLRQRPQIEAQGLMALMDLKMAMLPVAAEMKINGMLARRSSFEWLAEEMENEMEVIAADISKRYFYGKPFNPNSTKQVRKLMTLEGLKGEMKTPTGEVSTSKKSIEHLRFESDAIEQIEQWRERAKIRDSFASPILELFEEDEETRRIRCDLKITRVTSGRFAASDPNLLAIPVRTRLGQLVRAGFEAEEGYVLGGWDLDQIEMRVMADESEDERLLYLFRDGKIDIHSDTASRIFHVPYDKVDKMDHRYPAKRAGFGVITGIQDEGLLVQLRMAGCKGWTKSKVKKLREGWFDLYPGVRRYMDRCKEECREAGGVIRDRWGMPRYLPAVFSSDKFDRWEAERQSHSHRIQGGAQGLIQKAMGRLHRELRPFGDAVRWIMQIHDELILEVMKGLEDEIGNRVVRAMQETVKLRVPVTCSGGFAEKWSELK